MVKSKPFPDLYVRGSPWPQVVFIGKDPVGNLKTAGHLTVVNLQINQLYVLPVVVRATGVDSVVWISRFFPGRPPAVASAAKNALPQGPIGETASFSLPTRFTSV